MTVCNHMMKVGAHRASFIFTDLSVELELCGMTVGQLDSVIPCRSHYIHLLTRAAVKFRKGRLILGAESHKLD